MEEYKVKVIACIPVHEVNSFALTNEFLDDFFESFKLVGKFNESFSTAKLKELNIESENISSETQAHLELYDLALRAELTVPKIKIPLSYLAIESTLSVNLEYVKKQIDVASHEEYDIAKEIALFNIIDLCKILLTLTELAIPGQIYTNYGIASVDGLTRKIEYKRAFPEISDSIREGVTWPPIQKLNLLQVVSWVTKTSFLRSPFATSRVDRTLAAYTHLINLNKDISSTGEKLFRSMQGLEAFYCDGAGDLRRQLSEKAGLWLGQWIDKKNIVGQLYDQRSKFVHGSGRLVYHGSDGWDEKEEKFHDNVSLSIRLLTATIQQCIIKDIVDINWSYNYKEIQENSSKK